jgi:alpha-beta hydrolase superfamily lysophospholipase/ubiquinone/menaquinone biosynthesis C-methylase UbiE
VAENLVAVSSKTDRLANRREAFFPTADGTELFYRHWPPEITSNKAVLLFHRGHEHSGRYQQLVDELNLPDCHFFAWDARGHGRSPGERGYAESFSTVIDDVDRFVRFICEKHGINPADMVVLGHSVAGVAVAAWVHDYAPAIRGMVLVTPAFRVKLYVPLALPFLRLRNRLGKSFITSYVRAGMLTHDPKQAAEYQNDPLISKSIATNILLDLHDTSTRLLDDAGAIRMPTLLLSAGSDWVVKNAAQRKFFNRLGSTAKQHAHFDGFYHAILHERDRSVPIARIREFIETTFANPPEPVNLLDGDPYTRKEFDRLSAPRPIYCPMRIHFALQKFSMKTVLKLSEGVRLGWGTGFDSGESLDHVYQNRATGITPLGRFIDRQYLNAIGWRGIRIRKTNLMRLLKLAIDKTTGAGQSACILDIAGGGGRYLLETLAREPSATAIIRDRSASALQLARDTAAEMGLSNVTFAEGDAFDPDSLANTSAHSPNVAIVSGLYELFGDNKSVRASLAGLARALPPGGWLIYTNQPWHPQIEMIARVLTNRDGKPWIMRRRTQQEMDQLVIAAGFAKQEMYIDKFGIFSVSLARRS